MTEQTEQTEQTLIDLPVPPGALWAIVGITVGLFLTVSAIVHHHWSYYGLRESDRSFAGALYYTVSGLLLAGMVVSALAYSAL